MTADATADQAAPAADAGSGSRQEHPRRAGRGRRRRNPTQARGPDKRKNRRHRHSGTESRSLKERKENRGGRNRRRGPRGGSRRGGRPPGSKGQQGLPDTDMAKLNAALAPDPDYVEPTSVFIHHHTRRSYSRDSDASMGQRPNWFVHWEDQFDQGHDY